MKKKIFTLFAFLAMFMGANAVEVEDSKVDLGKSTIGWKADMIQDDWITADDDGLHLYNPAVTENFYDYQLFITPNFALEADVEYTVKVVAKVSDGSAKVRYRFGTWGAFSDGEFDVTSTEYQEYPLTITAPASSCGLMVQFGDYVGTVSFKSITITHEERDNQQPKVWIPLEGFENGDAETPWADPNVGALDAENNYKICAWGKENSGDPHPALIEEEEGNPSNHVFVVKAGQYTSAPWDNQFWIMMPREIKSGEKFKISFRYKASENVTRGIQGHGFPSEYRNNFNIGTGNGLAFTTEWQTYEWEGSWDNVWSIVWNLNVEGDNEVTYYFDDISIQELKLDHGWFIASANTQTGAVEYDFANAIEFTQDGDYLVATVGTMGKENTWVNQVMISTVRGDDGSFRAATIKPSTKNIKSGEDEWVDFEAGSKYAIDLPAQGVWKIKLLPDFGYITFVQLEGDEIVEKEPVAIVTNATESVVNGTERQDLRDDKNQDTGAITVKEEADDPDGVTVGGEGHEGQPWDNQFWIAANRDLKADEVTVLKFKYKASKAAKTSTQVHKVGGDGKPCTYLNWQAIGDVNFTEEWQDFETTFTIPAGDDGMRSIVFNMAEIKEACDYYIKDVQWYIKDDALEAEGKTMENLIDADGDANFWIKVNSGAPEQASGISSVVSDKKATNVTYNLAGQRVSKGYKGIVIKNGSKYIVK